MEAEKINGPSSARLCQMLPQGCMSLPSAFGRKKKVMRTETIFKKLGLTSYLRID